MKCNNCGTDTEAGDYLPDYLSKKTERIFKCHTCLAFAIFIPCIIEGILMWVFGALIAGGGVVLLLYAIGSVKAGDAIFYGTAGAGGCLVSAYFLLGSWRAFQGGLAYVRAIKKDDQNQLRQKFTKGGKFSDIEFVKYIVKKSMNAFKEPGFAKYLPGFLSSGTSAPTPTTEGFDMESILDQTVATGIKCPRCGKNFSFEEGVHCALDNGKRGKVVTCPKCRSVYEADVTSRGITLRKAA
jgi:hypothetical protein